MCSHARKCIFFEAQEKRVHFSATPTGPFRPNPVIHNTGIIEKADIQRQSSGARRR